jgi:hypothetical protein
MIVYLIGNSIVPEDGAPLALAPMIRKTFPAVSVMEADPNENFIPEKGSVIIDTVKGITEVTWFTDVDAFVTTKSVTPHDYDVGFHLKLLQKLGKLPPVRIIGIPYGMEVNVCEVVNLLKESITLVGKSEEKRQKRCA